MQALQLYGNLADQALLLGLASTRVAAAFLLLPVFSTELIPATIRNALFLAFGLLALAVQPALPPASLAAFGWLVLFVKEAFVGVCIGMLFGALLWAFESAGQVIDTKVGTTMAQIVDPLSGHETSLTGAFLGRLAGFVFMFAGGLAALVGVLVHSYALWPLARLLPELPQAGSVLMQAQLGRIALATLLLAAPVLAVLYLIEGVLGLINRYAQQLNVFALSMSIKSVAAVAMVWLMLAGYAQILADEFGSRAPTILQSLRTVLGEPR